MRSLLLVIFVALLNQIPIVARGQIFETLYSDEFWPVDRNGGSPLAELVKGSDGYFYGTTSAGGKTALGVQKYGTVFRITPEGDLSTIITFDGANGSNPKAALIEKDGSFYGTTYSGGTNGYGTVFRITSQGELTTLVSFSGANGSNPQAALVEKDGVFYGTTSSGGANGYGTVFRITSKGELTTLVSFDGANGRSPQAALVEKEGSLYGTTYSGGANDYGTIFKITPDGDFSTLVTFDGANGRNPAQLIKSRSGDFYGTTHFGGEKNFGTIFKLTPEAVLTTLFSGTDAAVFGDRLSEGGDGSIFGSRRYRWSADGREIRFFRMSQGGVLTWFKSGFFYRALDVLATIGISGLLEDGDGSLYGTTAAGGANGHGSVFRLTPDDKLAVTFAFGRTNGSEPSSLVEGSDGSFYGTTRWGGQGTKAAYAGYSGVFGTIFKIAPDGRLTTIFSFDGQNGSTPEAGLVEGDDDTFYGTTSAGGGGTGDGTVFKVTKGGILRTLVRFDGSNGRTPSGTLIKSKDGNFYGKTYSGGSYGRGTVFKMSPTGMLTTLVSFDGSNGANPSGPLVEGRDGSLYGTTSYGGATNYGTVFRITPDGVLTTLVSFGYVTRSRPMSILEGSDGNLYGTTSGNTVGTVFRVTLQGELTTLASFPSHYAPGVLFLEKNGSFYGTMFYRENGNGTLFVLDSQGVLRPIGLVSSNFPVTFVKGSDGKFYGTGGYLTIRRLAFATPDVSVLPSAISSSGASISGTVNANGAFTSISFEYGTTSAYVTALQ